MRWPPRRWEKLHLPVALLVIALRNAYHGGNASRRAVTAHSTLQFNVPHSSSVHHAMAVLEVIENEKLQENSPQNGGQILAGLLQHRNGEGPHDQRTGV